MFKKKCSKDQVPISDYETVRIQEQRLESGVYRVVFSADGLKPQVVCMYHRKNKNRLMLKGHPFDDVRRRGKDR